MKNGLPIKIELPQHFLEQEERCGYTVTAEAKKLWAVELDLLAEVDRVCKQYGISYLATAGTMLGAVRHQGFIPWDDDIDLMMTWENYKKLCDVGPTAFREPYFFQTDQTDRGSTRGHIQIRNSRTTAILLGEKEKRFLFNQGVFIDIFCLDHIPDDEKERRRFFADIKHCREKSVRASWQTYRYTPAARSQSAGIKRFLKDIRCILLRGILFEERAYAKYEKAVHRYNETETEEMGIICILKFGNNYCWKRKDIESDVIYLPFEFVHVPVPSSYDHLLRKTYGNWHEYVRGTSYHGTLFVDTEHSYKDYICKDDPFLSREPMELREEKAEMKSSM